MNKVFILMGESGSGKTELSKQLETQGYKVIHSYTTRTPRSENEWGHIFCTEEEYQAFRNIDQIVAYTHFNGYHYFCTREQIENNQIYVVDPDGIEVLKKNVTDIDFITIHIKVDKKTRIDRMYVRGDDIDAVLSRITNDGLKFSKKQYDYAVANKDLDKAVKIISHIISVENESK